ncbi:uncharacterized protein [Spinacia oleracea]|uniref:Uncharacterized protein n=1 Tax=Spinacia oleracea TaxID=3562 RepID=A0ABM3RIH6_SPIOL|nr:uncharacterized protein LOC110783443 [Spinacia oleracea]
MAHEYENFEQYQQVSDLNEMPQDYPHECEVGPHQTSGISDNQLVPFLFDLNMSAQQARVPHHLHYIIRKHNNIIITRINNELRLKILLFLLLRKLRYSDHLIHGTIEMVVRKFDYTRKTIRGIWQKAKAQKAAMDSYLCESKYHNCGRKRIQVTYESIASIGMGHRTSIRDLAKMLNLGPTTICRMVKRKQIKTHSSPLHPDISEECKMARMSMYDFIHIDEKWFYLAQKCQRVYLANNEPFPHRKGKSRTKIPKFMFMAAVARPRWGENGQCEFDGKIGIFPFTDAVAAKRRSKNGVRGTIETKSIKSVNQIATRVMLINYLIPAIKEKWSPYEGEKPANNPDCKILDLGFFRSIQLLMDKKMPKTVEDLSGGVIDSFNELHAKTLSNVWMSLQYVGNEILKHKGDNNYQLPHNKKKILEDDDNLPEQVKAPFHH